MLAALEEKGMKGYDISDDEMSKSHARYMIGGCKVVTHERVFRFGRFPFILLLYPDRSGREIFGYF